MGDGIARTLDLTRSEEECGDTPLQLVRRAYDELGPGDVLEVKAVVAEHAFVVRAWAVKTGKTVLDDRSDGKATRILLRRSADA